MKALPTISLLRHHGRGTGAQCVSPLRAALRAIESSQVSCPSCQWPAAGRHFSVTSQHRDKDWEAQARALNQKGLDDQEAKYGRPARHDTDAFDADNQTKGLQTKTPWHRYGADVPPAERRGTNEPGKAMTKGKLLTTPSRLLKLILPLQNLDKSSSGVDIEPLALLVHPQQPLSYLERLIQSEIPAIKTADGKYKAPDIQFRAEDSGDDLVEQTKKKNRDGEEAEEEGTEAHVINGELVKTGKANSKGEEESIITHRAKLRGGPGQGGVESYSGEGHDATARDHRNFVRWSSSTEIGDFIRDAARGKEFAVLIEGADNEILVGVPSFHDRTYYLRLRLRKAAAQLDGLTKLKHECDNLAHRSAQRLAMGGFGGLVVWWALVYYLTFRTSLGWDAMEPVTYLAGLSTIMMGYLWFLYHNREVSYRAALNLTVSRRQNQLYEARGFDVHRWESLIEEANALRKEIKIIANEYDVDWDEKADTGSEEVVEELRKERRREKKRSKDDVDDDDVDPPPPKKEKD